MAKYKPRAPKMHATAAAVLSFLNDRADKKTGIAYAKRIDIATAVGVSENSARSALKRLEVLGEIVIHQRVVGGRNLPNAYRVAVGEE